MGPLVPDIVSNELNLVVGFLIGIAFGFVLEQAGFSSSRKLTGLFYGTDFTVLRVFLSAGMTAMIGVVLLDLFGLLDMEIVYLNPTYVYSGILGGAIMGVGFVVGGYCPGTSFCGAAIGKIDAIVFVLGGFLGVLGFAEVFPFVRPIYTAGAFGDITIFDPLGLSRGSFVLVMAVVAVVVFMVTTRIERRVNPDSPAREFSVGRHRLAAACLLALALAVAATPDRKTRLLASAQDPTTRRENPVRLMTADELAFRILDSDPRLQVIDVRDAKEFETLSLPGSVNIPVDAMFGKEWRDVLGHQAKEKVFVGREGEDGASAATLARLLRYDRVAFLEGGLATFQREILSAPRALAASPIEAPGSADVQRFRERAGPAIAALIKERGAPKPVAPRVKKIVGGCGA